MPTAAGTPDAIPPPSGNVIFHRYTTLDCTGGSTDQTVALTPGNPSTTVSDTFAAIAIARGASRSRSPTSRRRRQRCLQARTSGATDSARVTAKRWSWGPSRRRSRRSSGTSGRGRPA